MEDTRVVALPTGWSDPQFQNNLNAAIAEGEKQGYEYHDVKCESGGMNYPSKNCLLILKKKGRGMDIITKGVEAPLTPVLPREETPEVPSPAGMGMHSMKKDPLEAKDTQV